MVLSISSVQRMRVEEAAAPSGPFNRSNLNFIEGNGLTITVADNGGSDRVDVTLAVAAGGAAPTASSWSANTETLTGVKTLTDSSETVQFLDPNGLPRSVNLPAPTTASPYFFIANRSSQVGIPTEFLSVVTDTGNVLAVLAPGEGRWCITDGTTWLSFQPVALSDLGPAGFATLFEGGSGQLGSGHVTNIKRVDALGPFTITTAYWSQLVSTAQTYTLYKNGASTGSTITTPGGAGNENGLGTWSSPVSYVLGDDYGVNASGATTHDVYITHDKGLTGLVYSGSLNADEYAIVGHSTEAAPAGLNGPRNEIRVPVDCTYRAVLHSQETAGGGIEIEVHVNGALSQAQNVDVVRGYLEFTETAITAGDDVALYSDVGGAGACHWALMLNTPYTVYQFGGDQEGGETWRALADYNDLLSATDPDQGETHFAIRDGRLAYISWAVGSAGNEDITFRYTEDNTIATLTSTYDVATISNAALFTTAQGFVDVRSYGIKVRAGGRFAILGAGVVDLTTTNVNLWFEPLSAIS